MDRQSVPCDLCQGEQNPIIHKQLLFLLDSVNSSDFHELNTIGVLLAYAKRFDDADATCHESFGGVQDSHLSKECK